MASPSTSDSDPQAGNAKSVKADRSSSPVSSIKLSVSSVRALVFACLLVTKNAPSSLEGK